MTDLEPRKLRDEAALTPAALAPVTSSDRHDAWLEVGVVLSVGVIPHLVASVSMLTDPSDWSAPAMWTSLARAAASAGLCISVLWIMRRSGLPWAVFGVVRPRPALDLIAGILVIGWMWVAGFFARILTLSLGAVPGFLAVGDLLPGISVTEQLGPPAAGLDIAAYAAEICVATASEELVLRAYLLPRLIGLLGSRGWAVMVVSVLAGSYHIYQGSYGAIEITLMQVPWCLMYLQIRRILPFVMAHAAYDMILML